MPEATVVLTVVLWGLRGTIVFMGVIGSWRKQVQIFVKTPSTVFETQLPR